MLGYRFWRERLNADVNVLGKTVVVGKMTYHVIGVLGAETDVPGLSFSRTELWVPRNRPRTSSR